MGRSPCCEKMGLKKGPWTAEEDQILVSYINRHGHGNWRALPKQAGLLRCGKSCRLRWINYLRPDIKRGNFTAEEEEAIIALHAMLGNRWSAIAAKLPGRTDNEIKNVWHTYLKKREHPTSDAARKDTKSSLTDGDDKAAPAAKPAALQSSNASAGFTTSLQSSASESSTLSAAREHNNEGCSGHGFPELPDLERRFWSEACLPKEKPVTSMEPFGSGAVASSETPGSFLLQLGSWGAGEDDMDFWLKMLTGAGELPQLPAGASSTDNATESTT